MEFIIFVVIIMYMFCGAARERYRDKIYEKEEIQSGYQEYRSNVIADSDDVRDLRRKLIQGDAQTIKRLRKELINTFGLNLDAVNQLLSFDKTKYGIRQFNLCTWLLLSTYGKLDREVVCFGFPLYSEKTLSQDLLVYMKIESNHRRLGIDTELYFTDVILDGEHIPLSDKNHFFERSIKPRQAMHSVGKDLKVSDFCVDTNIHL